MPARSRQADIWEFYGWPLCRVPAILRGMVKPVNHVLLARYARRMADLGIKSDAELERLADLKPGYINNLRRGESWAPTLRFAKKLAKAFDRPIAWVMEENSPEIATVNDSLTSAPAPLEPAEETGNRPPEGSDNMIQNEWQALMEDLDEIPDEAIPAVRKMVRRLKGGAKPRPTSRRKA